MVNLDLATRLYATAAGSTVGLGAGAGRRYPGKMSTLKTLVLSVSF